MAVGTRSWDVHELSRRCHPGQESPRPGRCRAHPGAERCQPVTECASPRNSAPTPGKNARAGGEVRPTGAKARGTGEPLSPPETARAPPKPFFIENGQVPQNGLTQPSSLVWENHFYVSAYKKSVTKKKVTHRAAQRVWSCSLSSRIPRGGGKPTRGSLPRLVPPLSGTLVCRHRVGVHPILKLGTSGNKPSGIPIIGRRTRRYNPNVEQSAIKTNP